MSFSSAPERSLKRKKFLKNFQTSNKSYAKAQIRRSDNQLTANFNSFALLTSKNDFFLLLQSAFEEEKEALPVRSEGEKTLPVRFRREMALPVRSCSHLRLDFMLKRLSPNESGKRIGSSMPGRRTYSIRVCPAGGEIVGSRNMAGRRGNNVVVYQEGERYSPDVATKSLIGWKNTIASFKFIPNFKSKKSKYYE